MEERRKYPRTEINEPAYVSAGGSIMSCIVRNISSEGAAIDVENPAFVPPRFRLVMANGTAVHECGVAWIQKNRTFTASPQPDKLKALQPRGLPNTLATVDAVMAARSECRWAAKRSMARSSIKRSISARRLFSSVASASSCL